jgi:hypothetical protein
VGVDLRRPEALVTEQLLYDTKVRAPVEKMRGERVTQRVRVKTSGKAGALRRDIKSCASTTLAEWRATPIKKERL